MPQPPSVELGERLGVMRLSADDFEESFARSSGPGGQHVNKTSTAVTLQHLPTGLQVQAQDSRSQHRNRALAWERLLDKIAAQRAAERDARRQAAEKERRSKRPRPKGVQRRILETKRRRHHYRHFNAASLIDAADGYSRHLDSGGRCFSRWPER
jgi:peptide chain release factor